MTEDKSWGKERAERFARPRWEVYAAFAHRITADWMEDSGHCTLLDLGSGPGFLLVEVKRLYPKARVIGVDPSEHMLEIARRNAESTGFPDIETIKGSAEHIPVDSVTVDLVVSQYSLHDWGDPEKGLSETFRVLKPGGNVVITDWNKSYPRWKFYLHNLGLMRRSGWHRAGEARNSFRRAHPFAKVLHLVREANLEPVETEGKGRMFFIKAVKADKLE